MESAQDSEQARGCVWGQPSAGIWEPGLGEDSRDSLSDQGGSRCRDLLLPGAWVRCSAEGAYVSRLGTESPASRQMMLLCCDHREAPRRLLLVPSGSTRTLSTFAMSCFVILCCTESQPRDDRVLSPGSPPGKPQNQLGAPQVCSRISQKACSRTADARGHTLVVAWLSQPAACLWPRHPDTGHLPRWRNRIRIASFSWGRHGKARPCLAGLSPPG